MSPLPSKLLPNTAQVEPYKGNTAKGPAWGDRKTIPCRFTFREQKVTSANGSERRSTLSLLVRVEDKLATADRVWVEGERYEVLSVQPLTGPVRVEGYQVALG